MQQTAQVYPLDIQVLQKSKVVAMTFNDGTHVELPCAYLRINSPSAEVQGHDHKIIQPKQVKGEVSVNIIEIEPVGNYAIKFVFDDGHNTGLFTWEYLYQLAQSFEG